MTSFVKLINIPHPHSSLSVASFLDNRVFSITWPAAVKINWNKRKCLHKKRVQLPQDWFGKPTWPPFHCFGAPIWLPWRHVKRWAIFWLVTHPVCMTSQKDACIGGTCSQPLTNLPSLLVLVWLHLIFLLGWRHISLKKTCSLWTGTVAKDSCILTIFVVFVMYLFLKFLFEA